MSGISFKISAPSRPASASAPPTRPSSGAGHRRPAPTSARGGSSSDEDGAGEGAFGASGRENGSRKRARLDGEEVVEFGEGGAKSKHARPAPAGPLVIPALPNKDWRLAAEELRANRQPHPRRKKQMYLPEAGGAMSMAPREGAASAGAAPVAVEEAQADTVNATAVVGGLEQPVKRARAAEGEAPSTASAPEEAAPAPAPPAQGAPTPLTDEQRALRELLGGAAGGAADPDAEVAAIYSGPDARTGPADEGDAFRQDVHSRPDEASLDDYARVPVGQFGLAMLRGMGWQPGQAASRTGRAGPTEAYVPSARPQLLGIGAKPMAEALGGDGAGGKGGKDKGRRRDRDEMKFVPLVKQVRGSGESASGSGRSTPLALPPAERNPLESNGSSRRASRSPPPRSSSRRDRDRDRDQDRSYRHERDERDRGSSRRERDYERREERRGDRREDRRDDRRERERDSGRRY